MASVSFQTHLLLMSLPFKLHTSSIVVYSEVIRAACIILYCAFVVFLDLFRSHELLLHVKRCIMFFWGGGGLWPKSTKSLKSLIFCSTDKTNSNIQVWNTIRVNKQWPNIRFGVNYSSKRTQCELDTLPLAL